MGWEDLLQETEEAVILPWTGAACVRSRDRVWWLRRKPKEYGWYRFEVDGRRVKSLSRWYDELPDDLFMEEVVGYLVGDRIVPDGARVDPNPLAIADQTEQVFLIEEGLERFSRVRAGRVHEGGPLIYLEPEFPFGPEPEVVAAYEDKASSVTGISGVMPGLDAAFRMETYRRDVEEKRRLELERQAAEEERKRRIVEQLGDGEGRRSAAKLDFGQAAKAALRVAEAEYLDHRKLGRRNEYAVRFRFRGRRYECTCNDDLRIVDAGICLQDHGTGEKGDRRFTLESLPAVIAQALRERRLVVWRHV